jgi:hypothetical protein
MKFSAWFLILLGLALPARSQAFFHTSGASIVDGSGNPYLIRSVALNAWLTPEAYAWDLNLNNVRSSGTYEYLGCYSNIVSAIQSKVGTQNASAFWSNYQSNYVTVADLAALKAQGINTIRIPFNFRLLLTATNLSTVYVDSAGQPVNSSGASLFRSAGLAALVSAVALCKTAGVPVILDMHSAPGGQSASAPADPEDLGAWSPVYNASNKLLYYQQSPIAGLWAQNAISNRTPANNQAMTAWLWGKIAQQFAAETSIVGYEPINEPVLPGNIPVSTLRNAYINITNSIRAYDTNHILFIQGNWYAAFFDGIVDSSNPPWDSNMVLTFHKYGTGTTTQAAFWDWTLSYLARSITYNIPIYLGEFGENTPGWVYELKEHAEGNNIGWSWWGWKKVGSETAAYSSPETAAYQTVAASFFQSSSGHGRLTQQQFQAGLNDLAANIASAQCVPEPAYFAVLTDSKEGLFTYAFNASYSQANPCTLASGALETNPVIGGVQKAGQYLSFSFPSIIAAPGPITDQNTGETTSYANPNALVASGTYNSFNSTATTNPGWGTNGSIALRYTVQSSADLITWTSANALLDFTQTSPGFDPISGQYITEKNKAYVPAPAGADTPAQFLRIQITQGQLQ